MCLTIAPAFFSAAIYLCLSRIIDIYSASVSRLKPQFYTYIFVTCDLISLILQAAGGALTATANPDQRALHDAGLHTMIAGLAFQVASMLLFMVLAGEYAWRLKQNWESRNKHLAYIYTTRQWKLFIIGKCCCGYPKWSINADHTITGLVIATVTIFARCIFRVIELSEGFNGHLFNDEIVFMIFEGKLCSDYKYDFGH